MREGRLNSFPGFESQPQEANATYSIQPRRQKLQTGIGENFLPTGDPARRKALRDQAQELRVCR